MKIAIIGENKIQHMRIQNKEWDNYYKLQYHLKIENWKKFINYVKKYEEIENEKNS